MKAGFTWLDGTVLAVYFVGITVFGLWIGRKSRSSGGYFLGDRKLPWWIMIGQAFGTGTHAENPVAQAGATYQLGFATIWYQWKNLLITPFYWLMAPWYRRSGRTTVADIIEDRYGRQLAFLYTIFALAFFIFNQGCMLKGAGKVISIATGGQVISPNGVVVAMTLAFIVYSFYGGLTSSAYTDFIQGFMIIVLSFMIIPAGLHVVGGFSGMRQTLPSDFFDLYNQNSGMDAFTITMLAINGLVGITAMPHTLSMNATGATERAGRVGQTYGAVVKRFCAIGWAFTGLIVAAMLIQRGQTLEDKELAFGFACRELLGPGLTGLMVACVLAANMSTCSNFMVNSGALFTRNLYREYLNPDADDRRLLQVGRLSGLALTVLGIGFALVVDQVLDAFLFTETIAALMGIMFLGGFLWPRANRWGAIASLVGAALVYYGCNYLMTCHLGGAAFKTLGDAWTAFVASAGDGQWREFLGTGQHKLVHPWKPGPFGLAMLVGFGAFFVVSWLTPPEDSGRIAKFFDPMRRSSDRADGPPAGDLGQDLLLLDAPGWLHAERWRGFLRRYREDLGGFALACAVIGFVILVAWAVMQIGR
jgi:Na+/proline symporter